MLQLLSPFGAPPNTSRAAIFIRLLTGVVFFLEGIKKFILPLDWGVGRFSKIGIWNPPFTASFVGAV